ncbi:hypothetical protein W59_23980 [Rhodococcus opacus RKJ300 = JCM 13270]|uniref:Uncharacterized protein n=1 Tax=Rhodococcus opacus RKJ300 = JCM 13270 TaxID=1165867 RepID=I0WLS7_RHOOP|nr:hypothetical protein W59_23980 [Rhodococcus opacus RKJ300 = JCM 13270]
MYAAHDQPTVVEQEQARQALQLLRDVGQRRGRPSM